MNEAVEQPRRVRDGSKSSARRIKIGVVKPGTKGVYDPDPKVRRETARKTVARRARIESVCKAPGCVDPATGEPRVFKSRMAHGEAERKTCSSACGMRLWRKEMAEKGWTIVRRDGVAGWLGPEGQFNPLITQPKPRKYKPRNRKKSST